MTTIQTEVNEKPFFVFEDSFDRNNRKYFHARFMYEKNGQMQFGKGLAIDVNDGIDAVIDAIKAIAEYVKQEYDIDLAEEIRK